MFCCYSIKGAKCAFENQKCKMHFWFLATSRKKCPPRYAWDQVRILQSWSSWEVTAKCAATSPCWCRTFWLPPIRTTFCRSDSGQRQNDADQSQTDNLSVTSPTNCRPRCTQDQVCILHSWFWSTAFYYWPDHAWRSLIPSCIFAIFLSGMDKFCIIAIFLWSRRFSPYNRNRRTNRGAPRKFQKSFENGSALPDRKSVV